MSNVADFLTRAANRTGFKREFYLEKNMPTDPSDVLMIPFFGDLKSTFILSSLILKSYKEANSDKYIVLCSWPGFQCLFPYVDEYWTIEDESTIKRLAVTSDNLYNTSNTSAEITRSLIEVANVLTVKDLNHLYDNGFTKEYWKNFSEVKRFLPDVPSANVMSNDMKIQMTNRNGKKIIVFPSARMKSWQNGKTIQLPVSKDFWIKLIECLLHEGYVPVVYQNQFTYDMSGDFLEQCIYLVNKTMSDVLAVFRHVGCVLDVHSGISRLAIAARCPFLSIIERRIFIQDRDYEVDDLCTEDLPRQYVFSFATQLMVGGYEEWEVSVIRNIVTRLREFMPTIDLDSLPSTVSSYKSVSYDSVRQRKANRIGAAFIKTSKNR